MKPRLKQKKPSVSQPFFRNCPAFRHSSHRIPPTRPVMGNIQVADTRTKPVTRLVMRKGPFFRIFATRSMNTGPIRMASMKWVANHT